MRREVVRTAVELLEVDPAVMTDTTPFSELGVDSLALVEYALRLEDVFDVELPEEEVAELTTVAALVESVLAKTGVRSAVLCAVRSPDGSAGLQP